MGWLDSELEGIPEQCLLTGHSERYDSFLGPLTYYLDESLVNMRVRQFEASAFTETEPGIQHQRDERCVSGPNKRVGVDGSEHLVNLSSIQWFDNLNRGPRYL